VERPSRTNGQHLPGCCVWGSSGPEDRKFQPVILGLVALGRPVNLSWQRSFDIGRGRPGSGERSRGKRRPLRPPDRKVRPRERGQGRSRVRKQPRQMAGRTHRHIRGLTRFAGASGRQHNGARHDDATGDRGKGRLGLGQSSFPHTIEQRRHSCHDDHRSFLQ